MANTQMPNESEEEYAVRRAIEDGEFTFVNGVALVSEQMLVKFLKRHRVYVG